MGMNLMALSMCHQPNKSKMQICTKALKEEHGHGIGRRGLIGRPSGGHRAILNMFNIARRRRCPKPDHPPCQIIPHPLAQSASAPGSCKMFYDSLFRTLRLAALIEWETEIRQAGEAVLFYLETTKIMP